jgi:hypothetical protein
VCVGCDLAIFSLQKSGGTSASVRAWQASPADSCALGTFLKDALLARKTRRSADVKKKTRHHEPLSANPVKASGAGGSKKIGNRSLRTTFEWGLADSLDAKNDGAQGTKDFRFLFAF